MNFLDVALRYAQLGWQVFPCHPSQKIPMTAHGVNDATSDEKKIREWWEKHLIANIAVACGPQSGIHVVDVDVSGTGANGWNTLAKLAQENKILPETIKSNTPRGGAHFFYKTDNPPRNKNSFLPGIDIRSAGYYVVLPPSLHPNGGQYEWAPGMAPWVLTAVQNCGAGRPNFAALGK